MNDAMTLSQRADALEQRMSEELDYIVIKSRLYSLAEGDMSPPPNAGAIMAQNPKARVLMGDDPRLPKMPDEPTLTESYLGQERELTSDEAHAAPMTGPPS